MTCDRPIEWVRGPPSTVIAPICAMQVLVFTMTLYLQTLQPHPLQVECMHHDSEGLHSCIIIYSSWFNIKVAFLGIWHLGTNGTHCNNLVQWPLNNSCPMCIFPKFKTFYIESALYTWPQLLKRWIMLSIR